MTASDITRAIVITGPTRGLGLEACRALATIEPAVRLVLLGRAGAGLDGVAAELRAAGLTADAVGVDFSSLQQVRTAGRHMCALLQHDGALVHGAALNAGLQTTDRLHQSVDGLELTFAVNVVAQHLLLRELLPVLAPGAVVVIVGSGTHFTDRSERLVAHPQWEDPLDLARTRSGADSAEPVAGQRAYATSKLAVNHLVHEWQRRHPEVRFNVHDPGMMPGTGLARDMSAFRRFMWNRVLPHLPIPGSSTPVRSGRVLAEMVVGSRFADMRGGYIDIDRASAPSAESDDPTRESRLWSVCEELVDNVLGRTVT